ncbi:MAG: DUF3999 domain-containing protein [Treponema sp.]|jgi:hypothetical protein|nr:DUF3999 domain-containing protein [Treponema sp.]
MKNPFFLFHRSAVRAVIFLALCTIPNTIMAEAETSGFAGSVEITGTPGGLLAFEIPEDVYRGLRRTDMGDIRIYDSSGNPAPFFVRGIKGTVTIPEKQNVPLLMWNEQAGRFTSSSPGIEINTQGIAVTINPPTSEKGSLYLADLSRFDGGASPSKLVLEFEQSGFFNARVSMRTSGDLSQWTDYGKTQTAAFYDNPGTDRNEFDIPRARYILLEFNGSIPAIHSAQVRFDPVENPAAMRETSFAGTKSADGKTARYHTEGRFPAARLAFSLSRPDSIRITVKDREAEEAPWRDGGETTVYRIERPGEAPSVNGPIDIRTYYEESRGPYWEIEVLGEQILDEVPEMILLWEARELVFLARGNGPWTLAYGSTEYGPPESPLSIQDGDQTFPAALGRAVYVTPKTEKVITEKWKQMLLWGVLGLAAAVLSGLAVYIIKSVKT